MLWRRRTRQCTRRVESEMRLRDEFWRGSMKSTTCMPAGDQVEKGERTRPGCSSTRLASNLRGACGRIESPAHPQRPAGGRGVRLNARERACSPNPVAPLAICLPLAALFGLQITHAATEDNLSPLRPPAVPLVAHDPYFSIWSPADKLTEADAVHWTGKPHRLTSLIRIDGKTYRLMGNSPTNLPALRKIRYDITPTRT